MMVGVDLGVTSTCAALLDARGEPQVAALSGGGRFLPSAIGLGRAGEILVAGDARRPDVAAVSPKRVVGAGAVDLGGGVLVAAEELVAKLLMIVRESTKGTDAVLAVPASFDHVRRAAMQAAARLAGLAPRRLVHASTAAALGAGVHLRERGRIAVCHIGASGLEMALVDVEPGVVEIAGVVSDAAISGAAIDERIASRLAGEIAEVHGIHVPDQPVLARRLKDEAERLKQALASAAQAMVQLPTVPPQGFMRVVKRLELDGWLGDFVDGVDRAARTLLAEGGGAGVDELVLSGGASRMPAFERRLEEVFRRAPAAAPAREELVARGAAVLGGILEGRISAVVLDVAGRGVGLHGGAGKLTPVIRRLARLPTREHRVVQTARDDQRELRLELFEGEGEDVHDARRVGLVTLGALPAAPAGEVSILVDFTVDVDGLIRVDARDLSSGAPARVELTTEPAPHP